MITQQGSTVFTSHQRRCHLLLTLYIPGKIVTPESISLLNRVDRSRTLQDIADTVDEIQRYYHLTIVTCQDGSYQIEGSILNHRLCLLHWLRRGLRLCPHFIQHHFTPGLKMRLKKQGIEKALYDDTNVKALVNLCACRLKQQFDNLDCHLLSLFLQYCLHQHEMGITPDFSEKQRAWTQAHTEFVTAQELARCWKKRVKQPAHENEQLFLALLFRMVRKPKLETITPQDKLLLAAIDTLMARFQQYADMPFSNETALRCKLYTHLSKVLDRCHFYIRVDSALPDEIMQLYPRLIRTTRQAFDEFERHYDIKLPDEEIGLVAIIFGAWLMQSNELQEKQVLLLTGNNAALEQQLEQQLREITLLPLNIKRLTLHAFQQGQVPKEAGLVITPYPTALPLYSPPLIHTTLPLGDHQQQRIREILETK